MSYYPFRIEPQEVPLVDTDYRTIKTSIPAPGTKQLLARLGTVESRSMHGQLPIVWDQAEDFSIYDHCGNRWIDFTSTIFVANVGHSNPRVLNAIRESLDAKLISCYAYASTIRAKYLEKLLQFSGGENQKAFLLSAGTEATEAVLKLMRLYGARHVKPRKGVICIENNWHGRTLGAQMMSSNTAQKDWIGFQDDNIFYISFPYPWEEPCTDWGSYLRDSLRGLEEKGISLEHDICGFLLETFQGWGAVFYPPEYVQAVKDICDEFDILLSFDEMQSGFGRTGRNFGYEHYDVSPDLIACGKGMGGGFPISGVIGRADIMDLPEVGNMSSTHSANPLACAAGLAVLQELEHRALVSEAERKGEIMRKELESLQAVFDQYISWVLGKGLIYAILFKDPLTGNPDPSMASMVAERCMHKGLLVVHTGRESVKIGPPLSIPDDAILEGVSVIKEALLELVFHD